MITYPEDDHRPDMTTETPKTLPQTTIQIMTTDPEDDHRPTQDMKMQTQKT